MRSLDSSQLDAHALPTLVRLPGRNLYAAAWSCMKLVPALHIIRTAINGEVLPPGGHVFESSSGTLALGLALASRAFGMHCTIVSDPAIDDAWAARLRMLGADLHIVPAPHPAGGWQRARLDRLHELAEQLPGSFYIDQYHNRQNAESYDRIAEFIDSRLPRIDYLVATVGSGGSGSGIARALQQRGHRVRWHAVDTHGSVLFGHPDRLRVLRGLGNSIIPENLNYAAVDVVHWVPPEVACHSAIELARDSFLDVGPTSGAAFAVARYLAARHPDRSVLALFPDSGERYRASQLNPEWLTQNGFDPPGKSQGPTEVDAPSQAGPGWCFMRWNGRPAPDLALAR